MIEKWKPIKDFEGLYEVSSLGRIKSLERTIKDKGKDRVRVFKERILTNICSNTGYHMVSLHANNHRQCRRSVHRLVMKAFSPIENCDKMIVDHINGIRDDNRLENLRWTTYFTNNRNTPYIRYLQKLLKDNSIEYIKEDSFEG